MIKWYRPEDKLPDEGDEVIAYCSREWCEEYDIIPTVYIEGRFHYRGLDLRPDAITFWCYEPDILNTIPKGE